MLRLGLQANIEQLRSADTVSLSNLGWLLLAAESATSNQWLALSIKKPDRQAQQYI